MAALSPAIRSGPALAVLIALAAAAPAGARDANASHRFSVYGSLTPQSQSAQGGPLQMQSRVSKPTATLIEQAGAGFVLNAKLAEQPLGCAGDTIFQNGFDP